MTAQLDAVVALAQEAGKAIVAVCGSRFRVDDKDDGSPVTEADHAAQELLVTGLCALTPETPVIAEEASVPDWAERRGWRNYWLLDPLDGTREFVAGSDEYAVNIALIRDGQPVLGVIHQPATGITLAAGREVGSNGWLSFLQERGGLRRPVRKQTEAAGEPEVVRVAVSRHYGDKEVEGIRGALETRFGRIELCPMGSSLKFCTLAQGLAEIYPRRAPTCEWDTAAGQAILESVGGGVFDLAGIPLRYNQKKSLINPSFVALASASGRWKSILGW